VLKIEIRKKPKKMKPEVKNLSKIRNKTLQISDFVSKKVFK